MIVENGDDTFMLEDTKKFLPKEQDYNNNNIIPLKQKFAGLSKEEVLAFSTDPAWVRLRWILFILFWLVWFALLGAVIGIVIITPKCPPRPNLDWWEKEIVYQVDVQKFMDSNGDGLGDLTGLMNKLEHFKDLGVETLCLKSNVLKDGSAKEFQASIQGEHTLKELKKTFKMNDIHVILEVPFKAVVSDESVLSFWLTEFADGVRISQTPDDADKDLLDTWLAVAKKVGDDTFEKKFLSFDAFPQGTKSQPSVLQKALFPQNVFTDKTSTLTFLNDLQKSFKNSTQAWLALMLGDFQKSRISNVISDRKQLHAAHGISLLLRGSPFVLYGDEIELKEDNAYMKWNSMDNCGFSTNSTLRLTDCENSVHDLDSHGAGQNLFALYKRLSKLRKEPSFAWGDVSIAADNGENIVSFVREAEGFDGYLVAANFNVNKKSGSSDFKSLHGIPKNGTVSYFYSNSEVSVNEFRAGLEVFTGRILLKPGELLVVKFDKRV